ncbi:MAG TPA: hypothetical protein VGW10_01585 [Solirubrobacteraceae bacterium]|nr:hypothetical protein [Solirubrobacteraceae bacterium]
MIGTDIALVSLLAVVILPFGIGWWIGNPVFAAAVFVAMAITVALGAVGRGETAGDPALGLALSLAVSAGSAAGGGYARTKYRARRTPRP